jgi:hypothetical protein
MFGRRRRRDDEIESHLAEETADQIAGGLDPTAARNAALRNFGNVESVKELMRERDPMYWLDALWQDVRFAFRLIARNRWVSATIVATLTVGIALTVSVFSLLNGLLLRPWVRTQPESIVGLYPQFSGQYALRFSDGGMSQPDYFRYRDSAKSLESLAAYRLLSLTLGGPASRGIRAGLISCDFFDVIRPGPAVSGRYFQPGECSTPMQAPVAIVSESFWRSEWNADPASVGRVIHVNRVR